MFTGIIESSGVLKKIQPNGDGKVLTIDTDIDLHGTKIGDSLAVNGACLTVVKLSKNSFDVDMAPETVSRTSFKNLASGAVVNIERALRLSDRLDGHLVSGHIDGTGRITSIIKKSNAVIITIEVPFQLACEMIEKGSVAIDGISLTINRCSDHDFEISIIPHTADITTIGTRKKGDIVNIETDIIGKYIKRFMQNGSTGSKSANFAKESVTMELLANKGFL
ncbi:MAG: riboflavin synthase [Thermodesulfobacteriota bacterium]|nr:riboflavin synthase [Thermodesulfobacteriota bacterium]